MSEQLMQVTDFSISAKAALQNVVIPAGQVHNGTISARKRTTKVATISHETRLKGKIERKGYSDITPRSICGVRFRGSKQLLFFAVINVVNHNDYHELELLNVSMCDAEIKVESIGLNIPVVILSSAAPENGIVNSGKTE